MEHDNEIEAARARKGLAAARIRVAAGAHRSGSQIEVTDPDPDRWARDFAAVLNADRKRADR